MEHTKLGTDTVEIFLKDNGIAEFIARPDMTREFNLNDMLAIDKVIEKFSDTHRLFLIHIRNGKYSQEARQHMSSQNSTAADKVAMVANKPLQKLAGNFFLGLNRPKIEIKLFNSPEKAIDWLLS